MRTFAILALCIGVTWAAGCVYEGRTYQQGQTWKKDCQFNCVCQDASTGLYQCTDICPHYGDLPPQCTLVKEAGSCCSKPSCHFSGSGGSSSGSGSSGGSSSGSGTGTFVGSSGSGSMTSSGSCTDKLNNCKAYGTSTCANKDYAKWVVDNCCAYCRSNGFTITMTAGGSGSGTMTGGSSGTSGTSGGSGEPFQLVLGGGSTGASGTMGGSCTDTNSNCAAYGKGVCSDATYSQWVQTNCCAYCRNGGGTGGMTGTGTGTGGMTGTGTGGMTGTGTGGTGGLIPHPGGSFTGTGTGTGTGMTGTGTGTGTGGTGTGTGGFTGTGTGTGMTGTGTCADSIPNCSQYGQATCTDPTYSQWVSTHCNKYCQKCSGGMTGTGTGGGFTGTGTGTGMTGTGTGTGMTGTGTGMTGTGTGGGFTGTGTGTGTGMTGACADAIANCAAYGKSVCSSPDYTQWVSQNCMKYCGKCSGGMTSTGTGTGTGTGMTGTGTGTGGSSGTGGFAGSSSGCVYKNQIYQQGQTFKDGCQFRCTCVDGKTGKYTCKSLCTTWQLPQSCRLNPPAAGKCCSTPNCPSSVTIQYPPGYTAE